jgi:flagella basal body P-ring formation protein FlgA
MLGVRCLSGANWQYFLGAEMHVFAPVWTTSRTLSSGQILSSDDLTMVSQDLTVEDMSTQGLRGIGRIIAAQYNPTGQQIIRPLNSGTLIRWSDLRDEDRLNPGDAVKVVYTGEGFVVATDGRSIGGAAPGQTVQIRLSSGKIVSGVLGSGHVVETAL